MIKVVQDDITVLKVDAIVNAVCDNNSRVCHAYSFFRLVAFYQFFRSVGNRVDNIAELVR